LKAQLRAKEFQQPW